MKNAFRTTSCRLPKRIFEHSTITHYTASENKKQRKELRKLPPENAKLKLELMQPPPLHAKPLSMLKQLPLNAKRRIALHLPLAKLKPMLTSALRSRYSLLLIQRIPLIRPRIVSRSQNPTRTSATLAAIATESKSVLAMLANSNILVTLLSSRDTLLHAPLSLRDPYLLLLTSRNLHAHSMTNTLRITALSKMQQDIVSILRNFSQAALDAYLRRSVLCLLVSKLSLNSFAFQ